MPNYIERKAFDEPTENFEFLLAKGISLLQKLTGNVWTDYNIHDPGITILEQLCFAFTDLSYRSGFHIEDILTEKDGFIPRKKNSFLEKKNILTSNAITINDYRKIILDEIDEIDNVDIIPVISKHSSNYIRGYYQLRVKLKDHIVQTHELAQDFISEIAYKIRRVFVSKRNLGENLGLKVIILQPQEISINAEILSKEFIHPEELLLEIYTKIQEYFSPQVNFYSERELEEMQMRVEKIYDGPLLKRGIIPDSELQSIVSTVDIFKIIGAISTVNGVLSVQKLEVNNHIKSENEFSFTLNENCFPILNPEQFVDSVKLFAGEYKLTVSKNVFLELLTKSNSLKFFDRKKSRHYESTDKIDGGEFKDLSNYISIQEHFPHIYGLGKYGVYANESVERKARVKQLRAYIFFFEQVFANYLAQLQNLNNFFSTDLENEGAHSFYYKPLYDIRGANEIISGTTDEYKWDKFIRDDKNEYITCIKNEQETIPEYRQRKHKVFEHLYSRFNDSFINYPVNAFINVYGELKGNKAGRLLNWKAEMLNNIVETEYYRFQAADYLNDNYVLGGFEKKLMRLLYIQDESKKRLSKSFNTDKNLIVKEQLNQNFKPTTKIVKWANETMEISYEENQDPTINRQEEGSGIKISRDHGYFFRNEGISVLSHGLNRENFRIGPSINNENEFIIIYKQPSQSTWRIISKHSKKQEAKAALDKLISYLILLSTESEGFHIVEHILLSPALESSSFGFRFLKASEQVGLKNNSWTSFFEREKVISEVIEYANSTLTFNTHEEENKNYRDSFLIKEAQSIKEELRTFSKNKMGLFPTFEMLVKLNSDKIIQEQFFNMNVTVVLPSWPARFQDPEFKTFVENLFNSTAPAHICFNFQWLGIKKMKNFEEVYFAWVQSLKTSDGSSKTAEILAELIGSNKYTVH